jgi:hypothetical protein
LARTGERVADPVKRRPGPADERDSVADNNRGGHRLPLQTADGSLQTRPQGARKLSGKLIRKLAGKLLAKLVRKLARKLIWKLGSDLASKFTSLHRDKLLVLLRAKLGNKLAMKLSA